MVSLSEEKNEKIGSKQNGNFLGILELLGKYDPFLSNHIKQFGNQGRGRVSYLSSSVCNEFISSIAKAIENQIISEVQDAKYFSLSVDSTPDVAHTDQLVFCFRYVKNQAPIERFLRFIPIERHISEHLTDIITSFLSESNINIMDCRGQSYDNASNMSGCYSGLQTRLTDINELAIFVPCASHSLNLVGKNAASSNKKATGFFDLLESLYHFFVYSTYRWAKLKSTLDKRHEPLLKRATGTRWSSKNDSVEAVEKSFGKIIILLKSLLEDDHLQTPEHKAVARGLIYSVHTWVYIYAENVEKDFSPI